MNRSPLLFALLLALTSSACSGEAGGGTPDADGGDGDGWAEVGPLFDEYCSTCHGSAWSSCWDAHDGAGELADMIQSGAMPRSGPMAPADKAAVLSWLQGGAPCAEPEPDGGSPMVGIGAAATP
jgi:hypothetical protein